MATAKQKRVAEPEFSVTLKIKGSKLETMATAAKKIGVEVVRVRKASVMLPLPGAWKLTQDNSKNEHNQHYRYKVWDNPDGREIVMEQAYEERGEQYAENFSTRDEYGRIGNAPTLEEAQSLFRERMTPEEFTDTAEDLAKAVLSDEPFNGKTEGFAEDILASLGIVKPKPKDELEVNPRRKPQYTITLTIEAHKLSAVEKKAKAAFGDDVRRASYRSIPTCAVPDDECSTRAGESGNRRW